MNNADKILSILVEQSAIGGSVLAVRELKEMLNLDEKEFEAADTYLLQRGYVDGTMGQKGHRSITAYGLESFEEASKEIEKNDTFDTRTILAKLKGLYKIVSNLVSGKGRYYDPSYVMEYFERAISLSSDLRKIMPGLFADLPERGLPKTSGTSDFDGRGYISNGQLKRLEEDLQYIFEVLRHSEDSKSGEEPEQKRIFIAHGTSNEWREVQDFIEKDLRLSTLELAQEPNMGRTILQKLDDASNQCSYAVIVMTGDDDVDKDKPRARENVLHEIGFCQGRYGLKNICLLHEKGTNIPSNIHGLVYIEFPEGLVKAGFSELGRELTTAFK